MTDPSQQPLSREELSELRHELRTPFNAIIGYTEMLLEEDGDGPLAPLLRELHTRAQSLLALVNSSLSTTGSAISRNDLPAFAARVQDGVAPLTTIVESIERQATGDMADDLRKIHAAIDNLGRLTSERLELSTPLPPQVLDAGRFPGHPDEPPSAHPRVTSLAWGKVLVVDDNEVNRDVLGRRLEREGYRPTMAASGVEALAMLAAARFDLVLLDIRMPEMDGFEVLRRMKASPAMMDIPVVLISALDDMSSAARGIEMGAEEVLPKPFDPVLLRARVGACLEKKRRRELELEYLRGVAVLESAASAIEAGGRALPDLAEVTAREDELGRLARVFQRMASEVQAREQRLRSEVQQLRIEIDEARKTHQVAEITGTEYFKDLSRRGRELRDRFKKE